MSNQMCIKPYSKCSLCPFIISMHSNLMFRKTKIPKWHWIWTKIKKSLLFDIFSFKYTSKQWTAGRQMFQSYCDNGSMLWWETKIWIPLWEDTLEKVVNFSGNLSESVETCQLYKYYVTILKISKIPKTTTNLGSKYTFCQYHT